LMRPLEWSFDFEFDFHDGSLGLGLNKTQRKEAQSLPTGPLVAVGLFTSGSNQVVEILSSLMAWVLRSLPPTRLRT
jgi:hypothetical protein